MREYLDILLLVRNAVAHSNGRIEVIKPRALQKIRSWEKTHKGLSTDSQYLTFTAAFVEEMTKAVTASLEDLIKRVKDKTE